MSVQDGIADISEAIMFEFEYDMIVEVWLCVVQRSFEVIMLVVIERRKNEWLDEVDLNTLYFEIM